MTDVLVLLQRIKLLFNLSVLVYQKVVERCPISNNFGHTVCDHRNCRVRIQLYVWVPQIVLIESVHQDEFVRDSSHQADRKQCPGILVEVVAVDCELMLFHWRCMWLSGIATAAASVNLTHR